MRLVRAAHVPYAVAMAKVCVAAARDTDKHFVFFNNMSGTGPNPEVRSILKQADIAYLSGLRTALAAIGHSLREPPQRISANEVEHPIGWSNRPLPSSDVARFRMFAAAGLPMAECEIVSSSEDAARAAGRMGYPLVIKGAAPEISHKSDLGLVRVGLHTAADVSAAYLDVAAALARETGEPR